MTESDITDQRGVRWLQSLTDRQFSEVFYAAVARRNTSDRADAPGHFVLADVLHDGSETMVDFIAMPAGEGAGAWGDDAPIGQTGRCDACGVTVRSWAKAVQCPVCGCETACS